MPARAPSRAIASGIIPRAAGWQFGLPDRSRQILRFMCSPRISLGDDTSNYSIDRRRISRRVNVRFHGSFVRRPRCDVPVCVPRTNGTPRHDRSHRPHSHPYSYSYSPPMRAQSDETRLRHFEGRQRKRTMQARPGNHGSTDQYRPTSEPFFVSTR